MDIILCNDCCGKGVGELNKIIKDLQKRGIKVNHRLSHSDRKLLSKYQITKDLLKKEQYLIIESHNICMPISWFNKRHQLYENMIDHITGNK